MSIEYAIIVKNKTRLELLIERFNTKAQARFYIESLGGNFDEYLIEHDQFEQSLHLVQSQLSSVLKNKILLRSHVQNYIFSENNIILVIGRDGLVANTAKYSRGIPIVAINPDEERYDGVLLPFNSSNFIAGVDAVLNNNHLARKVQFAEAKLNDGQNILAFNDLFIGAASHVSARYKINYAKSQENHSSSGIIVSTSAGSTGWLSSIFNMAYGVAGLFEKNLKGKRPRLKNNELLFAVREPYKSVSTQCGISAGIINQKKSLVIESQMPNNGIIFSDGIESDFLKFNSGAIATIGIADETANLVLGQEEK